MKTLSSTKEIGLTPTKSGKVRDIFDLGDKMVIIATDRISAFDVVLPQPIPYKGVVLTQLTRFWSEYLKDVIENHVISFGVDRNLAKSLGIENFDETEEILQQRTMVCKKAKVVPIECVVRGYLSGSGWKEYKSSGTVCGIKLPPGLRESDKLPEPIFTPATKADVGHDENISFEKTVDIVGKEVAETIKNTSLQLYKKSRDYAETKGIIIADTKFEFGINENGKIILIDECLTPDSSRFWPKDKYQPGQGQPSFDKQFVRDYLETLDWDKTPPAPPLPDNVIKTTSEKYQEIYTLLVGKKLKDLES